MERERDRLKDISESEKEKYLEEKEAKLEEELQINKRELQHTQEAIKTLTEQKTDLKKQRERQNTYTIRLAQ